MMELYEALEEADSHKKSNSLQCLALRRLAGEVRKLQLIVSGKTQFDAIAETAERCAKMAENCPPEVTMFGDHKRCQIPRAIAGAIRKTFGLSD